MNESRRIVKNTTWLFSATVISAFCDIILFALIARYLGPEELGIFTFLLAVITIFTVFSNLGLDTLVIRDVARENDKASSLFSNIIALKAIMSIISILVFLYMLHLMKYSSALVSIGMLFSCIILLKAVLSLNEAFFEAFERFEYMGILKILYSLIVVIIAWILLQFIVSLVGIVVVMIISTAFCVILGWILLQYHMFSIKLNIDTAMWKSLLKEAYPFVFASFMGVMYAKTDILMLSKMVGNNAVGVYSAAYKIVNAYGIFPSIVVMALFPFLSRRYKEARDSVEKISNLVLRFLMIVGVPMVIFCSMDSEKIIYLLYGKNFSESSVVLQILGIRGFTFFTNVLFGYMLFTANKQRIYLNLVIIALFVNVILNVLLIPHYGVIGASIATAFAALSSCGLHLYCIEKFVCKISFFKSMVKPLLSAVLVCVPLYFIKNRLGLILDLTITTILYIGILFIVGGLKKEDIDMIKEMVLSRGQLVKLKI